MGEALFFGSFEPEITWLRYSWGFHCKYCAYKFFISHIALPAKKRDKFLILSLDISRISLTITSLIISFSHEDNYMMGIYSMKIMD